MIAFDFADWPDYTTAVDKDDHETDLEARTQNAIERARLMNVHIACLMTTAPALRASPVSPERLVKVAFDTGEFEGSHNLEGFLYLGRKPANLARMDFRIWARETTIEADEVGASFDLLADLLAQPNRERLLRRVELLLRAVAAFRDHDSDLALVNAWTASEALVADLWDAYLEKCRERPGDDAGPFMNRKRLDDLRSSDMTAWHRLEGLSLADEIPVGLYRSLTDTRRRRNRFLHGEQAVSTYEAVEAVRAASELFDLVYDIQLRLPLSRSM
jgi:hypothetical protein